MCALLAKLALRITSKWCPTMVRNSRLQTRLFFSLVLAMGLFGAWYANTRVDLNLTSISTPANSADWVEFFALVGQEVIQLFLGITSGA